MMEILPDLDVAENADVYDSSAFIYATTDSIADFTNSFINTLSSDIVSTFDSSYGDSSFGGGGGSSGGGGSGVR